MNASSYRGGAILFLRLFSISFVPFPFHYNECFFVHQFGKGGTAENDEASGADGRTGWEIEREAFFSTQHQTAQTETAALGWFYCDSPTAAALLLLWWGVDTVWNGFSLLNL